MCGQESDGDRGAVEEKERNSETQVVGYIRNHLSERELSGDETQCRINWKRLIRYIDPT